MKDVAFHLHLRALGCDVPAEAVHVRGIQESVSHLAMDLAARDGAETAPCLRPCQHVEATRPGC